MPDASSRSRLFRVLCTVGILLCAGLLYAFLCRRFSTGIPCPLFALTGWKCPGCGSTRMCLALLRGDWREAFRQNRAVLLLLPCGLYLAAAWCFGYIRRGDRLLHGAAKGTAYAICVILLIFGILRNVYGW